MVDRPARRPFASLNAGALLREARALAGISQAELAVRIDTTQPVVSRWERGIDQPRVDALARALFACGFSADLVFRRIDDVDRAQIRAQLALTPAERLVASEQMSELVGLASK
ncbi:MAG: helix-turn-helix transcriptional regulator [Actinobacteria bacterium]|nr:helix-turn-helix transcriptional regulator [Actinomycetota bacterium]